MPETVKGLEAYKRRLATLPDKIRSAAKTQIEANAADLVAAIQRNAPVDPKEQYAGQLRDSVRWYPHQDRELSVRIIADARDENGKPYAAHVEFGHSNADGSHTPARPFFFPMYRALKRKMRSRVMAATRKVIKTSGGS